VVFVQGDRPQTTAFIRHRVPEPRFLAGTKNIPVLYKAINQGEVRRFGPTVSQWSPQDAVFCWVVGKQQSIRRKLLPSIVGRIWLGGDQSSHDNSSDAGICDPSGNSSIVFAYQADQKLRIISGGSFSTFAEPLHFRYNPCALTPDYSIYAGLGGIGALFSCFRSGPTILGLLCCQIDHPVGFFGGLLYLRQLIFIGLGLPFNGSQGFYGVSDAYGSDNNQSPREDYIDAVPPIGVHRHGGEFGDAYGFLSIAWALWIGFSVLLWGVARLAWSDSWRRCYSGVFLLSVGLVLVSAAITSLMIGCLPWDWETCLHDGQEHSQRQIFHGETIHLLLFPLVLISKKTILHGAKNLILAVCGGDGMYDIAMLVFAAVAAIGAVIAALPPLGFDVRIFGRPNMPLEGIPYFRARQAWIAIIVALISLGISAGAFYYFFRPRVVEKIVEKPVEKIVERQVPQDCSKLSVPQVKNGNLKKGTIPVALQPEQKLDCGGGNCAQSSGQQGGITAGQLNIDTDRRLTPKQIADIRAATTVCAAMPFIHVTASSDEAKRYAYQFIAALQGAGCKADLDLPIPSLRPNIFGTWVGVRDMNNPDPSASSLSRILDNANVTAPLAPMQSNFFPNGTFVLIVGAKESK
jgi:hypothetical protein